MFRVSADAVGSSWLTFRRNTSSASRTGSGLDETQLTGDRRASGDALLRPRRPDAEQLHRPGRHRPVGRLDVQRVDRHPQGQLQQQLLRPAGLDRPHLLARAPITICRTAWAPAGPTTTSATPDCSARTKGIRRTGAVQRSAARLDRRFDRDGATISRSTPTRRASAATPRCVSNYDFSHAEGNYLYTIPAGSPIPTPNQLPNVFNKLQQLHVDVRHRLSSRLAATFSYLYEPLEHLRLRVRSRAWSTASCSRARWCMGYVYRPYTAHSVVFGIRYLW